MKKLWSMLLVAGALACTPDTPAPTDPCLDPAAEVSAAAPDKQTYIVTFSPNANPRALAAHLAKAHGGEVKHVYEHAMRGMTMTLPAKAAAALAKHRDVTAIELDQRVTKVAPASWGLDRINQVELPLDRAYAPTDSGAGVTAYILDTGLRSTHQEFAGRVRAGFSAVEGGTEDCDGHGTHVAGTVAGRTFGVAPKATIVAVRVLGCDGSGTTSGVIAGIDWVAANAAGPAVANMSLGGGPSIAMDAAVARAVAKGVTFVVAAGNESYLACFSSPASAPAALTVAASSMYDAQASFSNHGRCVDLFAPGVDIRSSYHTGDAATYTMSGTSMASPHVAGAVAQYLGRFPAASPAQVAEALLARASVDRLTNVSAATPNKLLYVPIATSDSMPAPVPTPTPTPAPTASFDVDCAGTTTCYFTNNSNGARPLTALWTFGDGTDPVTTIDQLGLLEHRYARPGTYMVWLTVTDSAGQRAATFREVTKAMMCRVGSAE